MVPNSSNESVQLQLKKIILFDVKFCGFLQSYCIESKNEGELME